MVGSFSAQTVRMVDLLSGSRHFATPGFQRPYSWTVDEVSRLLDDILFALGDLDHRPEKANVFFMGTIVLIRGEEREARGDVLDIVDGQQRLVTLTLMMAVLRDLARAEGDTATAERLDAMITFDDRGTSARAYRVAIRDRDEAVLARYAKELDSCFVDVDHDSLEGAPRDIIANRNYLRDELGALDRSVRPRLAHFLESNCQVVAITTDDTDNAFRIFNVVNQQGKPLSRNDLLKAELIGSVPEDDRDRYVRAWEDAERVCGTEFEQLFSHIRTALGNGRAPIISEIRRLVRREGGGKAFLDRHLLPMARLHAGMLGRLATAPELGTTALRHVRTLERLTHSDWLPPTLAWLHAHPVVTPSTTAFLAAMDRLGYAHLLLGLGRDKRAARYATLIDAIREGREPHAERGAMTLSPDDVRNIMFNLTNNLYERSSIGCKLLLLRINDAMGGGYVYVDPAKVTVEHVLPQKVGRNSRWKEMYGDDQRSMLAGSLGNLVLVSPDTNKAARNSDFETKIALYRKDASFTRLPINQSVMTASRFEPETIRAREARMLDIVRDLWGFTAAPARRLAS